MLALGGIEKMVGYVMDWHMCDEKDQNTIVATLGSGLNFHILPCDTIYSSTHISLKLLSHPNVALTLEQCFDVTCILNC
jgi:hypothetical protein